jgi:hypothetical protein
MSAIKYPKECCKCDPILTRIENFHTNNDANRVQRLTDLELKALSKFDWKFVARKRGRQF